MSRKKLNLVLYQPEIKTQQRLLPKKDCVQINHETEFEPSAKTCRIECKTNCFLSFTM